MRRAPMPVTLCASFPLFPSNNLKAVVWCKVSSVKSAASQAVSTDAADTSAYALTIEKAVASKIDADTAGELDAIP